MKINEVLIVVVLVLLIILACVLLTTVRKLEKEVDELRQTVEWNERMNQVRYDSLDSRIKAIEEEMK